MIQDFTFFANITASYVKKKKSKTKPEVRMEYKIISSLYFAPPFRHFKHVLNAHKQELQNRTHSKHKRITWLRTGEKKAESGWKWWERGTRTFPDMLTVFLQIQIQDDRWSRSRGLLIYTRTDDGGCFSFYWAWTLMEWVEGSNQVKKWRWRTAVGWLGLIKIFGRADSKDPVHRFFLTWNLQTTFLNYLCFFFLHFKNRFFLLSRNFSCKHTFMQHPLYNKVSLYLIYFLL